MHRFLLLFSAVCLLGRWLPAQDEFLTSYRAAPLLVNPAEAGRLDYRSRFSVVARTQWNAVSSDAYYATHANWELQFSCLDEGFFGLSVSGSAERSAASGFRRINGQAGLAYHLQLGNQTYLSAGGELGIVNYALGNTDLRFDAQYDGVTFVPGSDNGENFTALSTLAADAAAGVLLYDQGGRFSVGVALDHLLSPSVSFLEDGQSNLPIGLAVHGNVALNYWTPTKQPNLIVGLQGLYRRYALFENRQWHTLIGLYGVQLLRLKNSSPPFTNFVRVDVSARIGGQDTANLPLLADAILLTTTFSFDGTQIGFTYDYTTSRFFRGSLGFGGIEIFLGFPIGGTQNCVRCPVF